MKKFLRVLAVIDLVLVNFSVIFILYQRFFVKTEGTKKETTEFGNFLPDANESKLECSSQCLSYIDEKLKESSASTNLTETPSKTPIPTRATSQIQPKVKRVYYVPIPGFGSTLQTGWTDLNGTDFSFDKADYPGFSEAYFEANIRLFNGNGSAFVRIFDKTHGVAVMGSEVSTSSQTSILVESAKLNFYTGMNLYKIQAKSLTADTTIFDSGSLKIISYE